MGLAAFNRRRRLLAEQQAKREAEVVADAQVVSGDQIAGVTNEITPLTPEQVDSMTKKQLIEELKIRNVEFNERENVATLKGVLLNAID